MAETPIIVFSSCAHDAGKSTVALNLAAALWSDGYKVKLFAPDNRAVSDFMEKRRQMAGQCGVDLPMPEIVDNYENNESDGDKTVLIAVISCDDNERYVDLFAQAHTLITLGRTKDEFEWSFSHPYVTFIWLVKKKAAARGIKYLNWIVLPNGQENIDENLGGDLQNNAKQFGYRCAEALHWRSAYRYVENGYCAADMAKFRQLFKMSMDDVYARREILNLTDDLWKHK